jgi:Fur family ferric uptake transcriptional regulator
MGPATDDDVPSPDDWQVELRARGYRLTPQRQLVLEAVAVLGHSTPDAIAEQVRRTAEGVNLSTVYRTLDLLEELGLVTHTHLGHGAPTYHVASEDDEIHLVCSRCGGVTHVDVELAEGLVGTVQQRHGFTTDVKHFAIYGVCRACSEATP